MAIATWPGLTFLELPIRAAGSRSAGLGPQHGDVGVGVAPEDARREVPPVGERQLDGRDALDHVVVGEHDAVGRQDGARARALSWRGLARAAHLHVHDRRRHGSRPRRRRRSNRRRAAPRRWPLLTRLETNDVSRRDPCATSACGILRCDSARRGPTAAIYRVALTVARGVTSQACMVPNMQRRQDKSVSRTASLASRSRSMGRGPRREGEDADQARRTWWAALDLSWPGASSTLRALTTPSSTIIE